jgi:hypothetical protein
MVADGEDENELREDRRCEKKTKRLKPTDGTDKDEKW